MEEKTMNNVIKSEELFKKTIETNLKSKSLCEQYRNSIILLKMRKVSLKKIESYLKDNGVNVSSYTIASYLKNNEITESERKKYKKYL